MAKSFLPAGYEVPKSSNEFMKFEVGPNKFRILSAPVIGWEGWKDGKPFRRPGAEQNITKDEVDIDEKFGSGKAKISHFWAFAVWSYGEEKVMLLEITQKTVLGVLQTLINDEDWGDPREYDITITKEKTTPVKYSVQPSPAKALKDSIREAYDASDIDPESLFGDAPKEKSKADKDFDAITGGGKKKR